MKFLRTHDEATGRTLFAFTIEPGEFIRLDSDACQFDARLHDDAVAANARILANLAGAIAEFGRVIGVLKKCSACGTVEYTVSPASSDPVDMECSVCHKMTLRQLRAESTS